VKRVQERLRTGVIIAALEMVAAGGLACAKGDISGPPEKEETPGVVSLDAPATAPADSGTLIRIVAVVDSALARDQRSVTFRTSAGHFPGGARETVAAADSTRTAIAVLSVSLDTGTAVITATAGGGTRRVEVRFVTALPELIDVTTDQVSVQAGFTGSLQVTAALRRNPGVPTPGQTVNFEAHAVADTQPRGRFSSEAGLSDRTGRVTVRFAPADSVYTGPLVIVSTTPGTTGVLRDSTIVQVVAPPR
jgi:hypothetical protein